MFAVALQLECGSTTESLRALYRKLDGENWQKGGNWFQGSDYCAFEGVKCEGPKIIELDLSGFGINRPFPDEIACFTDLKSLLANGNAIKQFPRQICDVYQSSLQYLDVRDAGMVGDIPDCICQMPYLQYIYVGDNLLSGQIPECLPQMGVLDTFSASCNLLAGELDADTLSNTVQVFDVSCNPDLTCPTAARGGLKCGLSDCNTCELTCPASRQLSACGEYVFVPDLTIQ